MSGAGSRARRNAANNRARQDVYARKGAAIAGIPFADPRQARIYEQAYAYWHRNYWAMESLLAEMTEVYGGVR